MQNNGRPAIEVKGLAKQFGEVQAVKDLHFAVEPGEIFGFMGHNGAGKTTAMRMLLGLTRPSGGTASVLGHDIVHDSLAVRRVSGYLPAAYALPPDMTAREFLHYVAAMFSIPSDVSKTRANALLERSDVL
jgi:ABC-2 type transport system ATP-binding protein